LVDFSTISYRLLTFCDEKGDIHLQAAAISTSSGGQVAVLWVEQLLKNSLLDFFHFFIFIIVLKV
jgi:hypothetical protein